MKTLSATAKKLIFFVFAGGIGSLHANTLVVPYPGLLEQEGMLQPSVLLGKPGFTFDGILSAQSLPSKLTLSAAFPLSAQKTLRSSGWMWAVRAGITEAVYEPNNIFSAGHYFVEAGLGRGTSAPLFSENTGIRGYMEVSIRNERPKLSDWTRQIANALNHEIEDKKLFLSLKIGAGSAHDSEGVVLQKPSFLAYRFQSQVYIPIQKPGAVVLNFVAQSYRACGNEKWICGLQANYQHHYETKRHLGLYEELSDIAHLGLWSSYYLKENIIYSARLSWAFIGNAKHLGFVSTPQLNLSITKAF